MRSDEQRQGQIRFNASTIQRFNVLAAAASLLLTSCANHHFQVSTEGPPSTAPGSVELLANKQVANLHFPAGVYSFYARDDTGWYYRAPRPIIQHNGTRSTPYNGGIYVSKRNPHKLRGYIFYAGALTHVGDFSRAAHVFH